MTFTHFTKIFSYDGQYSIKDFKGKRIAIDVSIKLIAALRAIEYGKHLTGPDGKITSHIKSLWSNIIEFIKYDIDQIWIFDDSTRKSYKTKEYKQRDAVRSKNEKRLQDLKIRIDLLNKGDSDAGYIEGIDTPPGSDDESDIKETNSTLLKKLEHEYAIVMTASLGNFHEAKMDLTYMLTKLGIKYIIAPPEVEAEQIGATLAYNNIIDYFITTDPDYLLFGSGIHNVAGPNKYPIQMLKKVRGKSPAKYDLYNLTSVIKEKNINLEQFIRVAVCLGVDIISTDDYNSKSGIRGIGPTSVIDKIKGKSKNSKQEQLDTCYKLALKVLHNMVPMKSIVFQPQIPLNKETLENNIVDLEKWFICIKGFNEKNVKKDMKLIIEQL